ncbi:hypothetical protein Pelo_2331 [Pelomyxa schiedti]|nr:hypothetical protein Pelo_2331 [Pelomyxa schiedti]
MADVTSTVVSQMELAASELDKLVNLWDAVMKRTADPTSLLRRSHVPMSQLGRNVIATHNSNTGPTAAAPTEDGGSGIREEAAEDAGVGGAGKNKVMGVAEVRGRVAVMEAAMSRITLELDTLKTVVSRMRNATDFAYKSCLDSWPKVGPEEMVRRTPSSPSYIDVLESMLYIAESYEKELYAKESALAKITVYCSEQLEPFVQQWLVDQYINKKKVQNLVTRIGAFTEAVSHR